MVTALPFAIFLGAVASAGLAFFALFGSLHSSATQTFGRFGNMLELAGIRTKPEQLVFTWLTATSAVWILTVLFIKPGVVIGLLLLPVAGALAAAGFAVHVYLKFKQRKEKFLDQFEMVLRLMASGLRSGLALQQTIRMVMDEAAEPARYEFARVLGQASIGTSIHDALDDLAKRIELSETLMFSRVVRINSQTGGDLSLVLERLASTIRERRRMRRKIKSMTAEGRAGAVVLAGVPIALGIFIVMTQPQMSNGLLHLHAGHIVIGIVVILEALGVLTLNRILQVSV